MSEAVWCFEFDNIKHFVTIIERLYTQVPIYDGYSWIDTGYERVLEPKEYGDHYFEFQELFKLAKAKNMAQIESTLMKYPVMEAKAKCTMRLKKLDKGYEIYWKRTGKY